MSHLQHANGVRSDLVLELAALHRDTQESLHTLRKGKVEDGLKQVPVDSVINIFDGLERHLRKASALAEQL